MILMGGCSAPPPRAPGKGGTPHTHIFSCWRWGDAEEGWQDVSGDADIFSGWPHL
ncbi:hypothetical protein ACRRTK_008385 [Alexandromys fortis]